MKQYYGSSYVIILLILKLYTANVSTFTATFHSIQDDDHYEKDVRFITASIGSVTALVVLPGNRWKFEKYHHFVRNLLSLCTQLFLNVYCKAWYF